MFKSLTAAVSLLLAGTSIGAAAELRAGDEVLLIERFQGLTLQFEVEKWPDSALGTTMTIDPPTQVEIKDRNANSIVLEFGSEVPRVDLGKEVENIPDGVYNYEITVGTKTELKRDEIVNNGRDRDTGFDRLSYTVSGTFVIDRKRIVEFEQGEEKGVEKEEPGPEVKDDSDTGEEAKPDKGRDDGKETDDRDGGKG